MRKYIGIDLGTTNSVVAVEGGLPPIIDERTGRERPAGKWLEQYGCTVIWDRHKRTITPSVVWDSPEGIVVGWLAKDNVGAQPAPIMFVKRDMGSTKQFALGGKRWTATEVSAEILRYVRSIATMALGEEPVKAVVTVPAWFDLNQKQATEEAARLAGLEVARILQEPVAAATTYTLEDTRDPLTYMVYDLGGGTFDVAVVRKEAGDFRMLAHDGDPFLGGCDFDRAIVRWLTNMVLVDGYNLKDLRPEESPGDYAIHAHLMQLVEEPKHRLAEVLETVVRDTSGKLKDRDGESVEVTATLVRGDDEEDFKEAAERVERQLKDGWIPDNFLDMIRLDVEKTVQLCYSALEKARREWGADIELDEMVMVGGSSLIPFVQKRIGAEFGLQPRILAPDLCVAVGAAAVAGTLEGKSVPVTGGLEFDRFESETLLPEFDLSGRVSPEGEGAAAEECVAELRRADGTVVKRVKTDREGRFAFQGIELEANAENVFALEIKDATGNSVATADRIVVTQGKSKLPPPPPVLAKAIRFKDFRGRLHDLLREGQELPARGQVLAERVDQSDMVRVPIYEGDVERGKIEVPVPPTLHIGSSVEVTAEVDANFRLVASAFIPSVQEHAKVEVEIGRAEYLPLDELKDRYWVAKAEGEQELNMDAAARLIFGKEFDMRSKEIDQQMQQPLPDLARLNHLVTAFDAFVKQIKATAKEGLQPPLEDFESECDSTRRLLEEKRVRYPDHAAGKGFEGQIDTVQRVGKEAWERQNRLIYDQANRNIAEIKASLERIPPPKPPSRAEAHFQCQLTLSVLIAQATQKGRLEEFKEHFDKLQAMLAQLEPKVATDPGGPAVDYIPIVRELQAIQAALQMAPDEQLERVLGGVRKIERGTSTEYPYIPMGRSRGPKEE